MMHATILRTGDDDDDTERVVPAVPVVYEKD
jgi:hypothetical protein